MALNLASESGSEELRTAIAALYSKEARVSPEHVITAAGTTGANMIVFQGLLRPGDHVIAHFPAYPQLLNVPEALSCEVSHWKLESGNGWNYEIDELKRLIRPSTKMLVLNNPNNPTGRHIDADAQTQILEIAKEHNLVVFVDEIFRPLYHDEFESVPPSFIEHDYSRVVVTGSMSKAWGLSGIRLGWLITQDKSFLDDFMNMRQYTLQATGTIDEMIATEALTDRCRPAILKKHLDFAQQNLKLLDAFVAKHPDIVSWKRPTASGTAFIKILHNDKPVDDVKFCHDLLSSKGVLLTPGSLCFGNEGHEDFRGYFRVHITTTPRQFEEALMLLEEFLVEKQKQRL